MRLPFFVAESSKHSRKLLCGTGALRTNSIIHISIAIFRRKGYIIDCQGVVYPPAHLVLSRIWPVMLESVQYWTCTRGFSTYRICAKFLINANAYV